MKFAFSGLEKKKRPESYYFHRSALPVEVTGCSNMPLDGGSFSIIVEDGDGFEAHEFAAIRRWIEHAYSSGVDSLVRQTRYSGGIVSMNLWIDGFGKINAVRILQPTEKENEACFRKLQELALQWEFPTILRRGSCSILLTTSNHAEIGQSGGWQDVEMVTGQVADR